MSTLNIPNAIVDGAAVEAIDLEQNFTEVETFVNANVLHIDGSTSMTGPLLLSGVGTVPLEAVALSQLDAAIGSNATAITTLEDADTAIIATATANAITATAQADAAEADAISTAQAYTIAAIDAADDPTEIGFKADLVGSEFKYTTTTPSVFLDSSTLANTKAGHYIISATMDVNVETISGGPGAFAAELYVGGVLQQQKMVWHPLPLTVGHRLTINNTWIIAAAAGQSKDFQIKVWQSTAGGKYRIDGSNHSFVSCLFVG